MKKLYVIGAGGHAKVVVSTLEAGGHKVHGAYDDNPVLTGHSVLGVPVCGEISDLEQLEGGRFILAVGSNRCREKLEGEHGSFEWAVAVHPRAYVHKSVKVGEGSVIFAGAVIQPGVTIGRHCIINTGATLDHDCVVEDFVHIAPGCCLAGGVTIRHGSFVGIGASLIQNVQVGPRTTIGAGATVVCDIPGEVVAYGVPARVMKEKEADDE